MSSSALVVNYRVHVHACYGRIATTAYYLEVFKSCYIYTILLQYIIGSHSWALGSDYQHTNNGCIGTS